MSRELFDVQQAERREIFQSFNPILIVTPRLSSLFLIKQGSVTRQHQLAHESRNVNSPGNYLHSESIDDIQLLIKWQVPEHAIPTSNH